MKDARVAWAHWLLKREFGLVEVTVDDYLACRERCRIVKKLGPDARKMALFNIILSGGEKEFFEAAWNMYLRTVGRRELLRTWKRKERKFS